MRILAYLVAFACAACAGDRATPRRTGLYSHEERDWLDPKYRSEAESRDRSTLMHSVQRCYQTQLQTQPALAGALDVTFIIDEEGRTSNIRIVDSTVPSDALGQCIYVVVRNMIFPGMRRPNAPVDIDWPLHFTPSNASVM